jgi:[ribosomal protein S5]-alanine N-acetyltransferase
MWPFLFTQCTKAGIHHDKKEVPIIQTDRLVLRSRAEKDIPNMLKMFNHEEVRKYLAIPLAMNTP